MSKKKGKLVIPGYIQKKGSLREQDANKKMKEIYQAIDQIYMKNASKLSFQHLYTNGYQVVLHKHGEQLYKDVDKKLKKYIAGIRNDIMKNVDSTFLESLLEKWQEHTVSLAMVRDILMYLDRTWIPVKKKVPVYELGIRLFGGQVFHHSCLERILKLVMGIINKERVGDSVANKFQLKHICSMMLEINKREIYDRHFEDRLINESRRFFRMEALEFFQHNTSTAYLEKVIERLKGERQRSKRCFHKDTLLRVERVVKDEMIDQYKTRIITKEGSGCEIMLKEWKLNDLKKVYEVLGLVPGALRPLLKLVHSQCLIEGYEILKTGNIKKLEEEEDRSSSNNNTNNENPIEMVRDFIGLWEKYDTLLSFCFSKKVRSKIHKKTKGKAGTIVEYSSTEKRDSDFVEEVQAAFKELVNSHPRLPEYMSLYIDSKIRIGKYQVEESEFDVLFEQVIRLFRYLREKDIFEKYYKIHLGKRLLANKSQSMEAEKSFISKLKTEFGYQFTAKIEGMFQDMKLNKEIGDNFKRLCQHTEFKKNFGFEMNVQVLTSGNWPIPPNRVVNVDIPKQLSLGIEFFEDYYLSNHSGRKLTWKYSMGTADIRANGFSRPYEIVVSTFQMLILSIFNESKVLTYEKIMGSTGIPGMDLRIQLKSLTTKAKTHGRVILREKCDKLTNTTKFQANDKFKSNMLKVRIHHVKMKQTAEELEKTNQKIDEERKWQLDACIVRNMKMRKKMHHRNLIMEVTKQMQHRFIPTPEVIKRRIESLIEREYMERSTEEKGVYNYLA